MWKVVYLLIILVIWVPTSYYFLYELPRHNKAIEQINMSKNASHSNWILINTGTINNVISWSENSWQPSSQLDIEAKPIKSKSTINTTPTNNYNSEKQIRKNQAKVDRELCNKNAQAVYEKNQALTEKFINSQERSSSTSVTIAVQETKQRPKRLYDEDIAICTELYDKELQRINLEYN